MNCPQHGTRNLPRHDRTRAHTPWALSVAAIIVLVAGTGCSSGDPSTQSGGDSGGDSAGDSAGEPPHGGSASASITPTRAASVPSATTAPPATEPVRVGPVELDRQLIDFGIVAPNTEVKAVVQIRNVTSATLVIAASVPTCQCTTVDMMGVRIQPGETVPMPMSMKTAGSTGIKQAAVTLIFEGHPNTPVQISIRSEVAYSVRATPPFIDVQQARRDPEGRPLPPMPLTGSVVLESTDGKPFRVLAFHGDAPRLVGFNPNSDAPRARYELIYDLAEEHRNGRVSHYKIIETDRADCPAIDMRVRHESTHIKPTFSLAEFRSAVGLLQPGEAGRFDLEIRHFRSRRIVDVVSKEPSIASTRLVGQTADGENVQITVEVMPTSSVRGLLYFPATIHAADGAKTDLIIFGRIASSSD